MQAFWAAAARDDTPLFHAAVTIGELRRGVELIRHRGDYPQAQLLEQWLVEGPEPSRPQAEQTAGAGQSPGGAPS